MWACYNNISRHYNMDLPKKPDPAAIAEIDTLMVDLIRATVANGIDIQKGPTR
jgi:hypothetical protein